ncbi:MAG: iron ABC transporter permease [Bacteroidetes bacterium]|nr:iron ABC transporter permease [Bacteroidota bacterium]
MIFFKKYSLLFLLLLLLFVLDIALGSVFIPIKKIISCFWDSENTTDHIILFDFRLPKALTAVGAGAALAVAGMLMQTFFRNPLAGPYVLGVNAVSSLFVAVFMMSSGALGVFFRAWGVPLVSALGALAGLLLIMLVAKKIYKQAYILLIGMMIGFIAGAWQSVLEYFANAQHLKNFVLWNLASLSYLTQGHLVFFFLILCLCFIACFLLIKSLNALLLGDEQARLLGVNIGFVKNAILVLVAVLSGVTTAYCGPIGFVGLALPHVVRIFLKTTHHLHQLIGNIIGGSCFLLLCDILSNLPFFEAVLPINVITSLFGAPFVLWLLLKKNHS